MVGRQLMEWRVNELCVKFEFCPPSAKLNPACVPSGALHVNSASIVMELLKTDKGVGLYKHVPLQFGVAIFCHILHEPP